MDYNFAYMVIWFFSSQLVIRVVGLLALTLSLFVVLLKLGR